jgi:hypothetical protein
VRVVDGGKILIDIAYDDGDKEEGASGENLRRVGPSKADSAAAEKVRLDDSLSSTGRVKAALSVSFSDEVGLDLERSHDDLPKYKPSTSSSSSEHRRGEGESAESKGPGGLRPSERGGIFAVEEETEDGAAAVNAVDILSPRKSYGAGKSSASASDGKADDGGPHDDPADALNPGLRQFLAASGMGGSGNDFDFSVPGKGAGSAFSPSGGGGSGAGAKGMLADPQQQFFAPGSRVLALNNRGKWGEATVTRVTSDGSCSVRYDAGDFDFGLGPHRLKPLAQ